MFFIGHRSSKSTFGVENIISYVFIELTFSLLQGGFFNWSAQKMTKYKEKLKYLNWSANWSAQKILSTRKKLSIRTEIMARV